MSLSKDPDPQSKPQVYFTAAARLQEDIQRLDVGASGDIYAITDEIVLKIPLTFYPLPEDASIYDRYVCDEFTIFHHDDIRHERDILHIIKAAPHPNIIQPIALEYIEGLYLPRYQPLQSILANESTVEVTRKCMYRDMLRALAHLHELKVAHADVRVPNILGKEGGPTVLCDFTCSRHFGDENPSLTGPSEPLGVNGPYSHVSDITDRFALGSVIYEIETGSRPALYVDGSNLKVPCVQTGDTRLDVIIRKAWFNEYATTLDMLQAMEDLLPSEKLPSEHEIMDSLTLERLRKWIEEWRISRLDKYGTRYTILSGVSRVANHLL